MHRIITLLLPILLWNAVATAGEPAPSPPKPKPKPAPTAEEIPGLIAAMATDDYAGKVASERLATAGAAAVDALIQATKHKTPRVRYWAIAALSSIGDKRGLPAVQALLADKHGLVRSVAIWHLARWWKEKGVRAAVLARAADPEPSVRGWVLKQIGRQKDVEAADVVRVMARKDADPEVRYDAVTTLTQLTGAKALDTLREVLREEPEAMVREGAVRCCTLIQPKTPETGDVLIRALRDKNTEVRAVAATLLRKGFNQYFAFDEEAPLKERYRAIRQWRTWYDANSKQLVWSEENQRFDPPATEPADDKQ
jgi:HEAT repeat protein